MDIDQLFIEINHTPASVGARPDHPDYEVVVDEETSYNPDGAIAHVRGVRWDHNAKKMILELE